MYMALFREKKVFIYLFFLVRICECVCVHTKLLQSCLTLCNPMDGCMLLCPWNSSCKNTGVGYHALLQGIFLTQGSNPRLLCLFHWQADSLPLASHGKPTIGETGLFYCFNFLSCFLTFYFVLGYSRLSTEKAMAPHSSTLAWKIPWTEEPGRLQSMGSLILGHDWATSLSLFTFVHWRRKWQPTPVFLPGESQGRGILVGCRLWGRTESDTTEAT